MKDDNFKYILRVFNTNLDGRQKVPYALRKIKGVGRRFAKMVTHSANIDANKRAGELTDAEVEKIIDVVNKPLEYGLPYNKFTKTISSSVYESGRYILNPFKSFLIYPANLVPIEFSSSKQATAGPLQTRTAEGLGLTLSVSFQYKVIKNSIPKLISCI